MLIRRFVDYLVAKLDPLSRFAVVSWVGHALHVLLWAGLAFVVYRKPLTLSFPALVAFGVAAYYVLREGEQWVYRQGKWWDHLGDAGFPVLVFLFVWWLV